MVDPEHRLVARPLAKAWADTRAAQRQLPEEDERFVHTPSQGLSPTERDAIQQLAQHSPALWQAPTPTVADRKELLRQILQRVIVQAEGESARLHMTIEWGGGGTTAGITPRPMRRTASLRSDPLRGERLRQLAAEGDSTVKITACLAQEGLCSPQQDRVLNRQTGMELMRRLGIRPPNRQPRPRLGPQAWRLSE